MDRDIYMGWGRFSTLSNVTTESPDMSVIMTWCLCFRLSYWTNDHNGQTRVFCLEKEPLPKELWYSKTNLRECQEKVERTRDRLERSKKLQLVSAISKIEFEKAELEAIASEAELARAKENARRVDEGLGQQYIEKAKRDVGLVAAKLEGKKAELAFLQKQIDECKLVAPATGRLVELDCKNTWYVARGKVAAKIASGNRSRAIARVDARVVRKVKPGQRVRVTSDVYNKLQYGNFTGVVKWIGDIPLTGTPNDSVTLYPVEVELDPEGYVLKYGSGVELAIVTGKQPAMFALLNMSDEDFDAGRKREAMRRRYEAEHLTPAGAERK